ncbi:MAG: RNA polymerase sigma factor [Acidobacteriaceae bacterium]
MQGYDVALAGRVNSDMEEIARGLRDRDVELLQTLVEAYQDRLVRYLTYVLGRRDGVDDLVQETWLRVMERGRSYDGRSRFEPWLFTVARNRAVDFLRRRREVSLDAEEGEVGGGVMAVSAEASPFVMAARTEDAARLAGALQGLQPMYREALVLRFVEEMSLQEIGAVMGAPVATVAARIYRGLAALRRRMEEKHEQ